MALPLENVLARKEVVVAIRGLSSRRVLGRRNLGMEQEVQSAVAECCGGSASTKSHGRGILDGGDKRDCSYGA